MQNYNSEYHRYRAAHHFQQTLRKAGRIKRSIAARAPLTNDAKAYQRQADLCAGGMLSLLIADPAKGLKTIRRFTRWAEDLSRLTPKEQKTLQVFWENWGEIGELLKRGISEGPYGVSLDEILEN